MRRIGCHLLLLIGLVTTPVAAADKPANPAGQLPTSPDKRIVVEQLAVAPEIVHPIKIACDAQGRLLVIESHTHFRPKDYAGPAHDRIRRFDFTKPLGDPQRVTTFFEGTDATMDIAVHPDGAVYLATRNEILRLRDTKNAGVADEKQRIAFLDTKGNYPHNGLEGLCFDERGNLRFGMGENLGEPYTLTGSDGTTISGGEGGKVFACMADGARLRRVATGFWNPFGQCRDIFGHYFVVDNDPDSTPPCRMVQVVEGGDYGFQFRYGRSGRHPFQSWNGQLQGTLPYISGVGEAPVSILAYESDGLPAEYLGQLLVTSWADHRVERYELKPRGATFGSESQVLVQGGSDFRPNGLALAPDGSLYISDWVLSDYNLHKHGAIWRISWKDHPAAPRPDDPQHAIASAHRPLRDATAVKLAATELGRKQLIGWLTAPNLRVRAAALDGLSGYLRGANDAAADEAEKWLAPIAEKDEAPSLRAAAVRLLADLGKNVRAYEDAQPSEVRAASVSGFRDKLDAAWLIELATDEDPFLRHAAVRQLAGSRQLLEALDLGSLASGTERAAYLLALRASERSETRKRVGDLLADDDENVRFLAIKWVADEKLAEYRPQIEALMKNPGLTVPTYMGLVTAIARLDGQEVSDAKLVDYFADRLADEKTPAEIKARALQLVPVTHKKLTLAVLEKMLGQNDVGLRMEALRALCEHSDAGRFAVLLKMAENKENPVSLRAQAIVGLAEKASEQRAALLKFALDSDKSVQAEALRCLIGAKLSAEEQAQLTKLAAENSLTEALVARVVGQPFAKDRAKPEDLSAWLDRLDGAADPEAGRRIFFHPKLANCARCHRAEGRGADIGPDLSTIGQRPRRHIVESIVQPSANIAPSYQAWQITTHEGQTCSGMLIDTHLDDYTYLTEKGEKLKLKTTSIETIRPSPLSIMPAGLVDLLTDQELRDLVAYLERRR